MKNVFDVLVDVPSACQEDPAICRRHMLPLPPSLQPVRSLNDVLSAPLVFLCEYRHWYYPCRSKHIEDTALSPHQDCHVSAEIANLTLESSVHFEVSILTLLFVTHKRSNTKLSEDQNVERSKSLCSRYTD